MQALMSIQYYVEPTLLRRALVLPYLLVWAPPPIERRPRISAAFEIKFLKSAAPEWAPH